MSGYLAELLDPEAFEEARQCRDSRFDGRFFVGVLTTGVYCRPVCPVRVPKKENVRLYRTAAAAAAAGFRPCLRCRPESSPGTPAWTGACWKVSRALQLIDQGFLDDASVQALAAQLDVGPRQLSRLFQKHLGASPVEVAQTRRLHFAKKLIDETTLPLTDVCFAAGFGSVRRFNAVFLDAYGRSPRQLRRRPGASSGEAGSINLTLSYRPPFDWRAMLDFLAYRAIPGVEGVSDRGYARTFRLGDAVGDFALDFSRTGNTVVVRVNTGDSRALFRVVDRIRTLLDLRADSAAIAAGLARDELLGALAGRYPGSRVPGCWDGLEVAVRAILGQQVTVKAATTLVGRVVERLGESYRSRNPALRYVFPDAGALAQADLTGVGIVGQRIAAIQTLARRVRDGDLVIDASMDSDRFVREICTIRGIGEWTAQYVAMRALNDPDAFPHGDLILRRAAGGGVTLTPKQLLARSQAWQPWRAYAVLLLWRHYGDVLRHGSAQAWVGETRMGTAAQPRKTESRPSNP